MEHMVIHRGVRVERERDRELRTADDLSRIGFRRPCRLSRKRRVCSRVLSHCYRSNIVRATRQWPDSCCNRSDLVDDRCHDARGDRGKRNCVNVRSVLRRCHC